MPELGVRRAMPPLRMYVHSSCQHACTVGQNVTIQSNGLTRSVTTTSITKQGTERQWGNRLQTTDDRINNDLSRDVMHLVSSRCSINNGLSPWITHSHLRMLLNPRRIPRTGTQRLSGLLITLNSLELS